MLSDDEFEKMTAYNNRVTGTRLNQKYNHNVDIGFGLDVNRIKSVQNFPVLQKTDGLRTNAKASLDGIVYDKNFGNKYNVGVVKHTDVPEIKPTLYLHEYIPTPPKTNFRMSHNVMYDLYGIPPDRDIVLENTTALAMNTNGMTEKEFMKKNFQKQSREAVGTDVDDFMDIPGMQDIIDSEPHHKGTDIAEEKKQEKIEKKTQKSETSIVVYEPINVEPAFTFEPKSQPKTPSKDDKKEDYKLPVGRNPMEISKVINLLKNEIGNIDKKTPLKEGDRFEFDNKLFRLNIKLPSLSTKLSSTYLNTAIKNLINQTSPTKKDKTKLDESSNQNQIITFKPKKSKKLKVDNMTDDMNFEKVGL